MKKSIFAMAIIATMGAVSFTSCSGEKEAEATTEEVSAKEYYCPMKCEGDKMHAEEGSCSVCGMDLVKD